MSNFKPADMRYALKGLLVEASTKEKVKNAYPLPWLEDKINSTRAEHENKLNAVFRMQSVYFNKLDELKLKDDKNLENDLNKLETEFRTIIQSILKT